MAQVYQLVDENGVTRLFVEIVPDPTGTPFNGGTITGALIIENDTFEVDLQTSNGAALIVSSGNEVQAGVQGVNAVTNIDPNQGGRYIVHGTADIIRAVAGPDQLGFYGKTPVSLQTGVAVSAAGIHAALVNLGLITA